MLKPVYLQRHSPNQTSKPSNKACSRIHIRDARKALQIRVFMKASDSAHAWQEGLAAGRETNEAPKGNSRRLASENEGQQGTIERLKQAPSAGTSPFNLLRDAPLFPCPIHRAKRWRDRCEGILQCCNPSSGLYRHPADISYTVICPAKAPWLCSRATQP